MIDTCVIYPFARRPDVFTKYIVLWHTELGQNTQNTSSNSRLSQCHYCEISVESFKTKGRVLEIDKQIDKPTNHPWPS